MAHAITSMPLQYTVRGYGTLSWNWRLADGIVSINHELRSSMRGPGCVSVDLLRVLASGMVIGHQRVVGSTKEENIAGIDTTEQHKNAEIHYFIE